MLTVPGLLQTPEYAAAVHRVAWPGLTADEVSWLQHITVRRQRLVGRGHVQVHALIDQAALLRPAGSMDVMVGQLDHLLMVTVARNVVVQVVGLDTAWPVLTTPFTVLSFDNPADPDVAYWPNVGCKMTAARTSRAVSAMRGAFQALADSAMSVTDTARLIRKLAARARSLSCASPTD